ncbi:metalloregulator ArsR/SmtB family transcription factor [Jannaschia aquimarina]|uniref:SdpR_2 protein n=1 Tax=Jannaschia aquimarina TaxID=935700 RepID=A0A0D1EEZ7_9RHOB|nr:metalloregulator ArsR/SmtB family transcription factor [Jannaschia aquimarina]KIT14480.1 Transcriptional repressor SdpR [Jannaschia aquimarina]SNT28782.1 transcriptional regulator, ArsR family [Jannaschia aquimarina]
MDSVFQALASAPRRKILAYLSAKDMTAGGIAPRFDMSKPSISKHLRILESAGLIKRERKGQFIKHSLIREDLAKTLNRFVQEVCPVGRPLGNESHILVRKG